VALRQLKGQLSERVSVIEDDLTWVLAHLEANIDFSAEDLESASEEKLISRLKSVVASTRALMASYQAGRIARNGFQVALVGVPNAGKSSLLNALVTEDRAIVSEHPGTTRDFVEVRRTIGGHLFCFVDTAGLRRTEDPIEKLGIEKTRQKIRESDVVLWVQDLTDPSRELSAETLSEACEVLIVKNKCDLVKDLRDEGLLVSARDGSGVEKVVEKLMELAQHKVGEFDAPIMQERQLECLSKIVTSVEKAIGAIENHISPEFIAFDLRESLLAVFELIGKRYDDEILDRVFKEFCLGK
jgi:tRNA modification GTPase